MEVLELIGLLWVVVLVNTAVCRQQMNDGRSLRCLTINLKSVVDVVTLFEGQKTCLFVQLII